MKYFLTSLLIFFWSLGELMGQKKENIIIDSTSLKNQVIAYPVIFYLPETRWGFGAAGLYNFRFRNESSTSNPSQIQFVTSFTQNKQVILTFPFELYFKENLWKLKGEVSYYRYLYKFYGVGIDSKFDDKEFFFAQYPRIRTDFLRRLKSVFAGLRIRFDQLNITKKDSLLSNGNYNGIEGGTISGLGFVAQWDKRDFIYNPTKGFYLETEAFFSGGFIGSDFTYQRYTIDFAKYTRLFENHTLATQIHGASLQGNPIFYELLYFGSPRLMRGYQDRRFIDKNLLCLQTEYRFPLYKRLQGVAFVSSGTVSSKFKELFENEYKWSYGGGLRFILNKKDRIRLRLDYGITTNEGSAFYITVNDAF
jgi:outer membrane protein assembly factor BamA